MTFRQVLDITTALVVEVYRELGMKFEEALDDLNERVSDPETRTKRQPKPADEAAGFALLQAQMQQTDFKGVRG